MRNVTPPEEDVRLPGEPIPRRPVSPEDYPQKVTTFARPEINNHTGRPRQSFHNPRPMDPANGRHENALVAVEHNIDLVAPEEDDLDYEVLKAKFKKKRTQYASLRAHQEIAANLIAAGATYELAAQRAGVSERQIRKYMTDSDFRARVVELREVLTTTIQGRILNRFAELVDDTHIKNLEVMDLARIFDRVSGASLGGGRGGPSIPTGNGGTEKYDNIIAQILVVNPGSEGADFPSFESSDAGLSGGDSPI